MIIYSNFVSALTNMNGLNSGGPNYHVTIFFEPHY